MNSAAQPESLLEEVASESTAADRQVQSIWLRLVAGSQQGASLEIPLDTSMSIGGDISCDIVLRDATDNQRATVLIDSNGVLLSVQSGMINIGDQAVESGMQQRVKLDKMVTLGDCRFTFTARSDAGEAASVSMPLHAGSESIKEEEGEDSETGVQATIPEQGLFDRKWIPIMAGAILASALLTVGLLFWQKAHDESTADIKIPVGELLRYSEFSDLELASENGSKVIKGFLPGRDDAIRLRTLLAQAESPVINKVQVGDELAGQVQNVYRVNGVDAEVRAVAAGEVEVSTQNIDERLLEKLEKIVKRDVPQIITIDNINIYTTVTAAEKPEQEPEYAAAVKPGERVKMVISSDPAHVVLKNNINYYIGSLMPSGQRIVSIEGGLVTLEKNGVRKSIQF
ncbi:MAG: hypothetical protein V3U76_09550 [Granulosicoccus sp.]